MKKLNQIKLKTKIKQDYLAVSPKPTKYIYIPTKKKGERVYNTKRQWGLIFVNCYSIVNTSIDLFHQDPNINIIINNSSTSRSSGSN